MESLAETPWDVTISGTGLGQSLFALALSRSGKKVLHVDKNPYYGGSEAAFSLQEAQEWADAVRQEPGQTPFEDAEIYSAPDSPEVNIKLSSSRAYTLSLSPHMIYSRSRLLPTLLSSRVYRQLEFQAVGSWWVYKPSTGVASSSNASNLYRVPSSREDVFADDFITVKSKRTLMKFIRHISKPQQDEGQSEEDDMSMSFPEYLSSRFQMPAELHDPLLSLSLSQASPQQTSAEYAVSRIKRHLASIGVFGPGFGSLLAKWGGGSELSQVGCRALAVGGGVYVLGSGIESITNPSDSGCGEDARMQIKLSNGESIQTKFVVGSHWDLPAEIQKDQPSCDKATRSISIVSSSLESLFPVTAEGGPIPAGAVVVFPGSSLGQADDSPPVHLLIHSSETGECPTGQSVIYGSISLSGSQAYNLLDSATHRLLQSATTDARVLWSLRYTQLGRASNTVDGVQALKSSSPSDTVICFPPPSLDHAFDDVLLDMVKEAWKTVMGEGVADEEFMKFEDREGVYDDE